MGPEDTRAVARGKRKRGRPKWRIALEFDYRKAVGDFGDKVSMFFRQQLQQYVVLFFYSIACNGGLGGAEP